jgi:hypothetical protein
MVSSSNIREIKTKYHLRDAILRQEIHSLKAENNTLKNTNKALEEEI